MNASRLLTVFAVALFVLGAAGGHVGAFSLVRLGLAAFAASFLFPRRTL